MVFKLKLVPVIHDVVRIINEMHYARHVSCLWRERMSQVPLNMRLDLMLHVSKRRLIDKSTETGTNMKMRNMRDVVKVEAGSDLVSRFWVIPGLLISSDDMWNAENGGGIWPLAERQYDTAYIFKNHTMWKRDVFTLGHWVCSHPRMKPYSPDRSLFYLFQSCAYL